jgi:hypothetical protein
MTGQSRGSPRRGRRRAGGAWRRAEARVRHELSTGREFHRLPRTLSETGASPLVDPRRKPPAVAPPSAATS